jgi:phage gp36-like protein
MYIDIEDFKAVVDNQTLEVIHQSDAANLERAVKYAVEEISGYLRAAQPSKTGHREYDVEAVFAATGDDRNQQLVMIACDVALYHLIAWLPKRIGFEIREIRYKRAIEWLESVQAGKATPDLPMIDPGADGGDDDPQNIKWGSWGKGKYDY